jgi:hypothetical protein
MTLNAPYRLLGAVAIAAGLARVASTFLPWKAGDAGLEAFALAIDIGLLLGLSGFYFRHAAKLGVVGLLGYAVAASGIAFITGPDGEAFGVDTYETGATVIGLGLLVLSVMLLLRKVAPIAGLAWIAAVAASLAGSAAGQAELGFAVAGVLFGLGFASAGFATFSAGDPVA